jgi:Ni/Co efflux regulator RcnB
MRGYVRLCTDDGLASAHDVAVFDGKPLRLPPTYEEGHLMKTKLVLAVCAALLASGAAMAAQTDDQNAGAVQTTKTVTTTMRHVDGANTTWYKEGGIVPVKYRGDTYVVQKWQAEHLNAPTEESHWFVVTMVTTYWSTTILRDHQYHPSALIPARTRLRRTHVNGSVASPDPFFWCARQDAPA